MVSLMITLGILITIAAIGLITGAAGRVLGEIGSTGNYIVAGVVFLVGLHLMDVIPIPWGTRCGTGISPKNVLPAFVLGLVFGLAVGPCTFAFMAPILVITFRVASTSLWYGVLLLAAYAMGHCSVIVLAGTFTEVLQRFLNWNAQSKGPVILIPNDLEFTYEVENTGNVRLDEIVLIDDNSTPGDTGDDVTPDPVLFGGFNVGDLNQNGFLDPGETSARLWLSYTLGSLNLSTTFDDSVNFMISSGGNETVQGRSVAFVPEPALALLLGLGTLAGFSARRRARP